MKNLFVLFFILFSSCVFAQVPQPTILWIKNIGGNISDAVATNVTKTEDGGFIISIGSNSNISTGNIDSFCAMNGERTIFIKYDSNANTIEWTKCFSYSTGDTGFIYIFPRNDGGSVLGGEFLSSSGWGFYICKQDAFGNIVWSHAYSKGNGILLRDMISTDDGGYIMAGNLRYIDTNFITHYGSFTKTDIGIIKVDSLGNKLWAKVLGGTNDDVIAKIIKAPDGGCYMLGATMSSDIDCTGNHGGSDAYLARLDNHGNLLWHNDLGGTGDDGGNVGGAYACEDGSGGIIVATVSNSNDGNVSHQINPGGYNIWALDADSNNNILWDNCYGGAGQEFPSSVCKASDGSLWIAGCSNFKGGEVDTSYGNEDAWFVHTDSVGAFLNAKVLGSHRQDKSYMIYPLRNGNIIAGGFYDTSGGAFPNVWHGGDDAFLIEFAPSTTEVKDLNQNNSLIIYPNPADGYVNIQHNLSTNANYEVVVSNVIGKEVYRHTLKKNEKTLNIQIKGWQAGIYFVQMISENGFQEVQKLIVQ